MALTRLYEKESSNTLVVNRWSEEDTHCNDTLALITSSKEDSSDTLALTRFSQEDSSDSLALTTSSEEDGNDTLAA